MKPKSHHAPRDRRNGTSPTIDAQAKALKGICIPGALKKCRCGATLKTRLDVQMHVCVALKDEGKPRRSVWDTAWA